MKTSYSTTAGTAWITFDNVRVPVGNTLGQEGGGIFVILRWVWLDEKWPSSLTLVAWSTVISIMNDG